MIGKSFGYMDTELSGVRAYARRRRRAGRAGQRGQHSLNNGAAAIGVAGHSFGKSAIIALPGDAAKSDL